MPSPIATPLRSQVETTNKATPSRTDSDLNALTRLFGLLPLDLPVAGRRRKLFFSLVDPIARRLNLDAKLMTPVGPITVNFAHAPERLLAYAFLNVFRYYEKSDLGQFIREKSRPGMTFVDIGANLGMYCLVARKYGMHTVAVEPEPSHSAFLLRNAETFGQVFPVALSDGPGHLPLYYEAENPGATSLFATPSSRRSDQLVRVDTFSALVESEELPEPGKISIIKIDVEGFEAQAVEGLRGFLDNGYRPSLWIEVRGDRSGRGGGSFRAVRRILSDYGYEATLVEHGKVGDMSELALGAKGVFDLLFTPKAA